MQELEKKLESQRADAERKANRAKEFEGLQAARLRAMADVVEGRFLFMRRKSILRNFLLSNAYIYQVLLARSLHPKMQRMSHSKVSSALLICCVPKSRTA